MEILFHPILHAAHLIEAHLRDALAETGLQPRQARVLMAIAEFGPIKQVQLAQAFDLAPPTMTVMLTRLERDGLVNRHSKAGDKQTSIALTPAGLALLPKIERAWLSVDGFIRQSFGAAEAEAFSRAACLLRDALGGKPPHYLKGDHP
jgi:DNA-binding MarR family transcriptional regulator